MNSNNKKAWGFKHSKTNTVLPVAFPTREKARDWKKGVKSEGALKEVSVSVSEVF